jgi:hypothetical protein
LFASASKARANSVSTHRGEISFRLMPVALFT